MKHRAAFVLTLCLLFVSVSAHPRAEALDVVLTWNTAALDAIRSASTSPPAASRALAILHTAMFDAVNGIERSYRPYLVPTLAPFGASPTAAANAAAYRVLSVLFPTQARDFTVRYLELTRGDRDSLRDRLGRLWGFIVAGWILESREDDGSEAVVAPPLNTGPGAWVPTPPAFAPYALPHWGLVEPFAVESGSIFRPDGPPALSSAEWAADFNEVKALGAAVGSTRTEEQSLIGLFWADGAGTETPPGHWNSIAQSVVETYELSLLETARLFALLNVAMADAAICAWDAKYAFSFWRPVTAIREADTDGNPATVPDPEWSSFITTPPFPDYVSGHSTFSGAAATVLAGFFGTDEVPFTAFSDALPSAMRTFNSFSEAAGEAALSRLYGGIHYRAANEDGLRLGVDIGNWTIENVMTPRRRPRS
jgi:hypothetical protein